MRILIITEFFPNSENEGVRGGAELRAFYVAKYLAAYHDVYVISSHEEGSLRESEFLKIKVFRCGRTRKYTQSGSFLVRANFIQAAIRRGIKLKVDLVDGYNWISHLAAFKIAQVLKIPSVATYHDVWIGNWIKNIGFISGLVGEFMERYILSKNWSKFIASSWMTQKKLIKNKIPRDKIEVLYNGVEINIYKKSVVEKYPKPTICYIGRLVKYKRVDDLIKSITILKDQVPQIQCKIIGIGPEESNLKKLAIDLKIQDKIAFLGFIPEHERVINILKKSHIFCLPSLVEGFGIVTIEALAAGVPYVNSNISVTREITQGGKGGLLFEPTNYEDLAKKVIQLLSDDGLYQEKKREGGFLVERYDWGNIVSKLENIYSLLI